MHILQYIRREEEKSKATYIGKFETVQSETRTERGERGNDEDGSATRPSMPNQRPTQLPANKKARQMKASERKNDDVNGGWGD